MIESVLKLCPIIYTAHNGVSVD